MALTLTPKQEKFCQCIVSGMSGKESYKTAYNTSASQQVIYNEANKLLQRDDITERIKELRKPLENHITNTGISETERIKQILWEEIENARQQQDHAAIARYTDQLNKLNNAYKDNSIVDNDNSLDNMDTSKLLKLVGTA
jgi:outer membrane protein assembly factor BamD (BamD/ComL family)